MADIEISRDAVQAGVDAYESAFLFDGTADMVEHILKAAAPLIVAAELERMATEFETDVPKYEGLRFDHGQPFRAASVLQGRVDQMRARAAELRAQS